MRRHPNWALAEAILSQIIPGAGSFSPDQIPGLTPDSWQEFAIDDRDPDAVNEQILRHCKPLVAGPLVVVTFQSIRVDVGPFFVASRELRRFVSLYADTYDDAFVAGDTVIASAATGVVVVIHHSGLIATAYGRNIAETRTLGSRDRS